jgi:membrane fusion protein (multidrug efflux system)
LLVPQRAVSDLQGGHQVAVVGADNQVDIRPVKVGERTDNLWIIDQGLNAGDRVVVEGLEKLKSGMRVVPRPVSTDTTENISAILADQLRAAHPEPAR